MYRLNFKITNDQGNFNHWRYSATYTERLSHWPYWLNEATADFEVKKLHDNELGQYSVESNHRTCFLFGLYCCKYFIYPPFLLWGSILCLNDATFFFIELTKFLCIFSVFEWEILFRRWSKWYTLYGSRAIRMSTISWSNVPAWSHLST